MYLSLHFLTQFPIMIMQESQKEVSILRVYLDNCCFNRPYDDQSQVGISLEAQAKLHIQDLIKAGKLELVSSFILAFENSQNPHAARRETIRQFIEHNATLYLSSSFQDKISAKRNEIMATGIKYKDASHLACAIYANCDIFVTTDKRLLKYHTDSIRVINPTDFFIFEGEI